NTLTDTAAFTGDSYANDYVWIYGGTGSGQIRKIESHTDDILTVDRDWTTNPSSDSTYRIIHTGSDPYFTDSIDGNGFAFMYIQKRPIRILESLTIDDTSITITAVYIYNEEGKLLLNTNSAEQSTFMNSNPQQIDLAYWWGVYQSRFPAEVKRYCIVLSALKTLQAQMGGTHNIPSTYTLPEASLTIGQAYINIKGTWDVLSKEKTDLESNKLKRYNIICKPQPCKICSARSKSRTADLCRRCYNRLYHRKYKRFI
ncbi:hypothetical protein LCGC14_2693480, partial [marine sediment metagenome]